MQFDSDAIIAIVDRSVKSGTGARALHSEIERVLMPHMFHLKQYQSQGLDCVTITEAQVNNPTVLKEKT